MIAKSPETLQNYIESVNDNQQNMNLFTGNSNKPLYLDCMNDLAEQANFTLIADMNEIMHKTPNVKEEQTLPTFFFKHKDFFKYFMLSIQFIYTGNHMNINLIFTFQGDSTTLIKNSIIRQSSLE